MNLKLIYSRGAGESTGRERIGVHDLGINPHVESATLTSIGFAGYEKSCQPSNAGRWLRVSSVVIVICFHLR